MREKKRVILSYKDKILLLSCADFCENEKTNTWYLFFAYGKMKIGIDNGVPVGYNVTAYKKNG